MREFRSLFDALVVLVGMTTIGILLAILFR